MRILIKGQRGNISMCNHHTCGCYEICSGVGCQCYGICIQD